MKLDTYYPVNKPSKDLYDKVYASMPNYLYEDNRFLFLVGVTIALASPVIAGYEIVSLLHENSLDVIISVFDLYLGG